MLEFKILNNVISYMGSTGNTYKQVTLSIDQELVDQINEENRSDFTLEDLQKATDKCLAHEWLEQLTVGKYGALRITSKGVGAARSIKKAEELRASRSLSKKTSDIIDGYNGYKITDSI